MNEVDGVIDGLKFDILLGGEVIEASTWWGAEVVDESRAAIQFGDSTEGTGGWWGRGEGNEVTLLNARLDLGFQAALEFRREGRAVLVVV